MAIMLTLLSIGHLQAQVPATGGAVTWVANPPADVSSNDWESNTAIRAFVERLGFVLPAGLAVDLSVPGRSPNTTAQNLSAGTIAGGTSVNSYTLHFDVVGTRANNKALEAIGTITFDQPILGIMVMSPTENNSNAMLGLTGLNYSNGGHHGLELNPGGALSDSITVSDDMRSVFVDLHNAAYADDIRIITAAVAVPEPGTFGLIMAGGILAAAVLWRRRRF